MPNVRHALLVCLSIFPWLSTADYTDCISTTTKPTVTRRYVLTFTEYHYLTSTIARVETFYAYAQTVTTTYTAPTVTQITGTVTVTDGTTTVGGVALVTKACRVGPSFIRRCPKGWTKTITEPAVTTSIATSTKTITSSFSVVQNFVYLPSTTTFTTTIVAGNPPTTMTSVVTATAITITLPQENTATRTILPSSIFTPTLSTATTTSIQHVKRLASPSDTATVRIFSLQVTNTSINADGLTLGYDNKTNAVLQNATTYRYYIDAQQNLRELSTDRKLVVTSNCVEGFEQVLCQDVLLFLGDSDVNTLTCPNEESDYPSGCPTFWQVRCKVNCGGHIKCHSQTPAADGDVQTYPVDFGAYLGGIDYTHYLPNFQVVADRLGSSDPINFIAVGPVKGGV